MNPLELKKSFFFFRVFGSSTFFFSVNHFRPLWLRKHLDKQRVQPFMIGSAGGTASGKSGSQSELFPQSIVENQGDVSHGKVVSHTFVVPRSSKNKLEMMGDPIHG